jgi:hypothetical protein
MAMAKMAQASPSGTVEMMIKRAHETLKLRRQHQKHHDDGYSEGDQHVTRGLIEGRGFGKRDDPHAFRGIRVQT